MTTTRLGVVITWTLFATATMSPGPRAESTNSREQQKIEALIRYVAESTDIIFVRNGKAYDAGTAATFLRRKWQAKHSEIKTVQDFIDKVASFSGTSGSVYRIRFKNGKESTSRDFLLAAIKVKSP